MFNKNILKNTGVKLYINEPESSIELRAFPSSIYFQMYLFINNFEINNKSLNKQVLCGAP